MQSSLFNKVGGPGQPSRLHGIFADFMKVIRNWYFIQLQITCNIVIEIQLQLLDLKCNSITITIMELAIQLHVFKLPNNTVKYTLIQRNIEGKQVRACGLHTVHL